MSNFNLFAPRLHGVMLSFLIFTAVLTARALQLGFFSRSGYLKAGLQMSRQSGVIPARRGEIRCSSTGEKLAWNERHIELISTLKKNESFSKYQLMLLKKNFPGREFPQQPVPGVPLLPDMTPAETAVLPALLKSGSPLKVRSRVRRMTSGSPELQKKIGEVKNGIGISGWEKEYDSRLRGTPGRYSVLLDRRRNWIPGTWKMLTAPVHGENITLPGTGSAETGGVK